MINKPVYVVANRHQEQEVLQHLENKHCFWSCDVAKPTQKLPSQLEWRHESQNDSFPYIIIENEADEIIAGLGGKHGILKPTKTDFVKFLTEKYKTLKYC